MSKIDYSNAPYPIRENLAECQNRYWQRLAAPGTWLTAAQRVDIAKEVRQAHNCKLCIQRKEALSPYQVDGAHDKVSELPDIMVEVVHRIITDSARLTKTWFEGLIEKGLKVEEYIEIVGTLVHCFTVDEFCRGLGVPLNDLPEPQGGEPSYYRPENTSYDAGAWIPMLPAVLEGSPEADLWDNHKGNVIAALSLVPDEVRNLMDMLPAHYLDVEKIWEWERSPNGGLSRMQIEVVAGRVSSHNDCFY